MRASKMKFHENPAAGGGSTVAHADGQASTKKSAVALRHCFAKASKMGKDKERISNGEKYACILKDGTE